MYLRGVVFEGLVMPRISERITYLLLFLSSFLPVVPPAQAQSASAVVERTEYDMRKVVMPPALSETELEGRRLVVQRCAYCHDQGAREMAPWLDHERIKAVGEETFRERILKGSRRMPGWQYALQPAQVDQIMAYLKTVAPDPKPKASALRP
jgi:mono/diheme cytochrome c family protein